MADVRFAKIDAASSGNNTIITAVDDRYITVLGYTLVAAADVTVQWKAGTTALTGVMSLLASDSLVCNGTSPVMQSTTRGGALILTLGGAVQVSGHVTYMVTGR